MRYLIQAAVVTSFLAVTLLLSSQLVHADEAMIPDRCPEPCEIGGTHVSLDYQRLTVPMRIRNGTSGNYLKLDGNDVSVKPLAENDDSFLWILLPGPSLHYSKGNVSDITDGNNFENRVYKLVNLKHSLVLGSTELGLGLALANSAKFIHSSGTDLGRDQFWLFQKDPNDKTATKYLIYNPKVDVGRAEHVFNDGARGDISVSDASAASMPALIQPVGASGVQTKPGASFRAAGFSWHFEEAPKPRDLARLTIKSVKALQVSTGRDENTDILLKSIKYAVEFGPMIYSAGTSAAAKSALSAAKTGLSAAAKGVKAGAKAARKGLWKGLKAGGRGVVAGAKATGRGAVALTKAGGRGVVSLGTAIVNGVKNIGKKKVTEKAAKASLKSRLKSGAIYVGDVAFRGGVWLVDKSGRAAGAARSGFIKTGKSVVKLGSHAARSAEKAARAGLKKAKTKISDQKAKLIAFLKDPKKMEAYVEKKLEENLEKNSRKFLKKFAKPLLAEIAGSTDPFQVNTVDNRSSGSVADGGYSGGELGLLKAQLTQLEKEWGGNSQSFTQLSRQLQAKLNVINPDYYFASDDTNRYYPKDIYHEYPEFEQRFGTLFSGGGERDALLKMHKAEIATAKKEKHSRREELFKRRRTLGLSESDALKEVSDLKDELSAAQLKQARLKHIESQIKEIESLLASIKRAGPDSLVLNDSRRAEYIELLEVSEEAYLVCSETKTYALPQRNPPYFRLGSREGIKAIAGRAKTLSDAWEGDDSDAALAKTGMVALDLMMLDITPILNEITKATDKIDDDLFIRVNRKSVWPNGGHDHRKISSGEELNVGVEYLFERGDDVTITLMEWDKGGAFASGDDHLGDLVIPSHHLYDIEDYEGVYIQKASEGSLYEVAFTVEPLYVPTPLERIRKKFHDVECEPVVKQAKAEQFALAVETERVEGRLALINRIASEANSSFYNGRWKGYSGVDALRTYDQAVAWADFRDCPTSNNYREILDGEWRVGRYDADGRRDYSVTWRNTFNTEVSGAEAAGIISSAYGSRGSIVTPSQQGRWRTESLSPGIISGTYVSAQNKTWENRNKREWKPDFLEAPYELTNKTEESCEIYAAMYDKEGNLGGKGATIFPKDGDVNNFYHEIGREMAFAMRTAVDAWGSESGVEMHRVMDKTTDEFKAVELLQNYYREMPSQKDGIAANLVMKASGPSDLWLEKVVEKPNSRDARRDIVEDPAIVQKIKDAIAGSWAVAPYKKDTHYPQKAHPERKQVWGFRPGGMFFIKPENDFWFTPATLGHWKYIGDQRIEVTTSQPVKLPVDAGAPSQSVETDLGKIVGDRNSGKKHTFILYMAHKGEDPTEFDGFYVLNGSGEKAVWSQPLHRGKSPFEMPQLYSNTFLDLLGASRYASEKDVALSSYVKRRKAETATNNAAMTTVLAELDRAHSNSPCDISGGNETGYSAFYGKWRVGQYGADGQKKYFWDYSKTRSPYRQLDPSLNSASVIKHQREIVNFRTEDVAVLDDPSIARVWNTKSLNEGVYQQQWIFADRQDVLIKSRIGNVDDRPGNNYVAGQYAPPVSKGDLAPPSADFDEVEFDSKTGTYVMRKDSEYLASNQRVSFKADWSNYGCNDSVVTLPDSELGARNYPMKFIYRENGDKEFYTTKPDGSLHLWGLQEADRSVHDFEYAYKTMKPQQAAHLCQRKIEYFQTDLNFPFSYYDENARTKGLFVLQNTGLTPFSIFRHSEKPHTTSYWTTLQPGDYSEFIAEPGEKIAFLNTTKNIRYVDRHKACIGAATREVGEGLVRHNYAVGKGYTRPVAKTTGPFNAKRACSTFISGQSYPGRLSEVEFKNNGTIPLVIYRLGRQGDKINPDGTARQVRPDFDPDHGQTWYWGLEPITTLEPGKSHKINTRVGYAFKAITQSTRRIEQQYRQSHGRVVDVHVGDWETCYGQIKISQASEIIEFSDEFSDEDIRVISEQRAKKRQEERRISSNLGLVYDTDEAHNSVSENAPAGTPVGITALAVDGDEQDKVSYSVSAPFGINTNTGEVIVINALDREKTASHTIVVTATSSDGAISEQQFVVALEDADEFDVGPTNTLFVSSSKYGNIGTDDKHPVREDISVGGTFNLTAVAEDKDATNNAITYSLSDDAGGLFAIGPASGEVSVANKLDYENLREHSIVVVATSADGSTSHKRLAIAVEDVNDADIGPVVDVDSAPNTVTENAPAGTRVGIVLKASDVDTGDKITYQYVRHCRECQFPYYDIDPDTGVVTTTQAFADVDLEETWNEIGRSAIEQAQNLFATAKSSDGSSSEINLQIDILDANEFKISPTWNSARTGTRSPGAAEDAKVGTPVYLTAKATDEDANAVVRYELLDDAQGRFHIDSETGDVTVAGNLDYERAQSHFVVVQSTSDGDSSQTEFEISVTDVDDQDVSVVTDIDDAPNTVAETEYRYSFNRASQPVGITAYAEDPDAPVKVRYSLKGGQIVDDDPDYPGARLRSVLGSLSIDTRTGVVTTQPVDFETSSTLDFVVIATSGESSSETAFSVDVTNINEFAVQEPGDVDAAPNQVAEDAAVGTPVGITVVAFDGDGDRVTFETIKPDRYHGPFAIDPHTGIVTVAGELDAEKRIPQNDVTVIATSSDGSTSERTFSVKTLDANEFDVSWEYNNRFKEANLREDVAIGAEVDLRYVAEDKDKSDLVSYELTNSTDVPFEIDRDTGTVTVSESLSEVGISSYTLDIIATSTDGSQARETFEVLVDEVDEYEISDINDLDDAPDVIDSNAEWGTLVGITAFAEDLDASDVVTYSLSYSRSETENPFDIDHETGVITVRDYRFLNAATRPVETLRVEARSNARSNTWLDFDIAVNRINEHFVGSPIDTDYVANAVEENAPIGTLVGITAFAEDRDPADTVTYRMAEAGDVYFDASADNDKFSIDPNTGVITVAGELDFETSRTATISVVAVSSDGQFSEYQTPESSFLIEILPVNEYDLTPFVDTDDAPNEVSDDTGYGTSVGITLETSDPDDVFINDFSIVDADGNNVWDGPFAMRRGQIITADTGKLKALGVGTHTLMIQATSEDGSTRTEEVTIDILGPKKWRDSPKGPRFEADYTTVAQSDRQICVSADEDEPWSDTYNNEVAYFDCLDRYIPAHQPDDPVESPELENPELACARQFGLEAEDSSQRVKATITNNHHTAIEIKKLEADGWPWSVASIQPGETAEIKPRHDGLRKDPFSGTVLVGLDANGICIGAGKPMDAENHFVFGADTSQVSDSSSGSSKNNNVSSNEVKDGQFAHRCSERGRIVSNFIEEESKITIRNTGSTNLNVHWIDYSGNEVNYQGENFPITTMIGGQHRTIDAWKGSVFIATDEEGQCVGIAESRETFDDYSFGDRSFNPANDDHNIVEDAEPGTGLTRVPSDQDTNLDNHQAANGCLNRGALFSNYEEISRVVSIANTGDEDLQVYWVNYDGEEVNYEGDRAPQAIVSPGKQVEIDAWQYFTFVIVDGAQQCVGVAHANSSGNVYSFGNGSRLVNSNAANDNQQSDEKEPGWDRDVVFFEPAYNYCTGEKGLVRGTQEYADCYYAY